MTTAKHIKYLWVTIGVFIFLFMLEYSCRMTMQDKLFDEMRDMKATIRGYLDINQLYVAHQLNDYQSKIMTSAITGYKSLQNNEHYPRSDKNR